MQMSLVSASDYTDCEHSFQENECGNKKCQWDSGWGGTDEGILTIVGKKACSKGIKVTSKMRNKKTIGDQTMN